MSIGEGLDVSHDLKSVLSVRDRVGVCVSSKMGPPVSTNVGKNVREGMGVRVSFSVNEL